MIHPSTHNTNNIATGIFFIIGTCIETVIKWIHVVNSNGILSDLDTFFSVILHLVSIISFVIVIILNIPKLFNLCVGALKFIFRK